MAEITLRDNDTVIRIHVPDANTFFYVEGKRIYMNFHDYLDPGFFMTNPIIHKLIMHCMMNIMSSR